MLIVGYDLNEQTYLVRNSWGAAWGDKGYCRIPFEVMDGCSHAEAFWIIGKLEQAGNFKVIRPREPQAPTAPGNHASSLSSGMAGSGLSGRADNLRDEIRRSLENDIRGTNERIQQRFADIGKGHAGGNAGGGACGAPGCRCQAYSGSGYICDNCGHSYRDHS